MYDFHDTKWPLAEIVVGLVGHSFCRAQQSQASCRFDLHETTHALDLSEANVTKLNM